MRLAPLVASLALWTVAAFASRLPAQDPVPPPPPPGEAMLAVTLTSGRTFAGHVDAATDDERLVLRMEGDALTIKRPIQWDRIVHAAVNDKRVELAQLQATAQRMKSEALSDWGRDEAVDDQEPGAASQEQELLIPPARVAAIAIDPRLANWDGDVEADGLLIDVLAIDLDGYAAAASGVIEVELFAPQRRVFHHAPLSGGDTLERVERWSRVVQADDFGPSGVRLKLPFGAVHPEFDLDWMSIGLVHAKFVAAGHGVFEDSRDAVRIRPYAPLRDQLELKGYPRFLPTEGVGRWQ